MSKKKPERNEPKIVVESSVSELPKHITIEAQVPPTTGRVFYPTPVAKVMYVAWTPEAAARMEEEGLEAGKWVETDPVALVGLSERYDVMLCKQNDGLVVRLDMPKRRFRQETNAEV